MVQIGNPFTTIEIEVLYNLTSVKSSGGDDSENKSGGSTERTQLP